MLVLLKRDVKLQLTNYHVSSEKCEIEGIILGLEVVIRLIVDKVIMHVHIFCLIVKRP